MAEGNGFQKEEKTARTVRMDDLEERAHKAEGKLKLLTWAGAILGIAGTLFGGGWTVRTYLGHVATAAEVAKLKAQSEQDREQMAAIRQAHQDDAEWRTQIKQDVREVKQQMHQVLDLMLGRARRSDGR